MDYSRGNEDYKFIKNTLGNHGGRGFNIITGGPLQFKLPII
jgi:hypothetical protein